VNSTIKLSFRYQERDYVRALRAHYASRLSLRLDIVVAIVLLASGVYLWRSPSLHGLGVTFVVIAIVFALMLIAAFAVIPPLVFRREPKFRDEYSLTFSPEGIHFQTAHIDSKLLWSMYSRALIDAHSYVLYYGSRQFTVIPKRVFKSAEEQEAFDQLLTQHVSQIVRRGVSSAHGMASPNSPTDKAAAEFVAAELEKLLALPLVTDEDEERWRAKCASFESALESRFPAFPLKHHVEHFFTDTDIRRKEPGYKDRQHREISDYIRKLRYG
jgi:hypothetical protein